MDITIICPLYKGESYIRGLVSNISSQKKVNIVELKFILTESNDNSEEILKELNVNFTKIKPKDFSHSLVREKEAYKAKGDIVVFITQDITISNDLWLYELVKDIENGNCEASFSRQIAYKGHEMEKYIREANYPEEERIVSKDDLKRLGLMTFFFSDASSAVLKSKFIELNGYDNKDLPTNEDMYFAHKLILNGGRIKYAAKSVVIHSHKLSFKDTYKRYKDIGRFFKQESEIKKYSANERGFDVLFYIIKRALKEKKINVIIYTFFNFVARFIGMRIGSI